MQKKILLSDWSNLYKYRKIWSVKSDQIQYLATKFYVI